MTVTELHPSTGIDRTGVDRAVERVDDVNHPDVDHPDVDHPDVDHPDVDHPEVDHPEVDHPEVDQAGADQIDPGPDPASPPTDGEPHLEAGPAQPAEPLAAEDLPGDATVTALPELVHVDPATLVVDANVRGEAHLDKPFVGSIRDHGVLVPIAARRDEDGQLRVLLGKRRTLGAVEAGRRLVPVYVIDTPDDEKAAEILRIIRQVIENDHRSGLRDGDRARAHHQLALLGLSAGQIARRTRTGIGQVKTSLQVAGSQLAAAAMDRFDLTLEQAAVLAEFDDDAEAVKELTVTARHSPDQFAHAAQRLRDARADAAARAELTAQLTEAGVTIIDPPHYDDRKIEKLRHLKPAPADDDQDQDSEASSEGTSVDGISPDSHAGCPGHAAYLDDRGRYMSGQRIAPVYVCTDWKRHGHLSRYASTLPGSGASGAGSGLMSEEDKAARRTVIANNKAWDSAEVVRRRWLKTFLARKTPPKDAPQWIAATLASCSHEIRRAMEDGHAKALELLGHTGERTWRPYSGLSHPVADAAATATPARATMLTLGLLLGGLEATTDRYTWRNRSATHRSYFAALQRWGYPLSDVEQLLVQPDPDPDPASDADPGSDPDAEPAVEAEREDDVEADQPDQPDEPETDDAGDAGDADRQVA